MLRQHGVLHGADLDMDDAVFHCPDRDVLLHGGIGGEMCIRDRHYISGGWSPAALDTRLIRQADLAIAVTIHSCPPGTRFCWIFAIFPAPIIPQIGRYELKYKAFSFIQCTLT